VNGRAGNENAGAGERATAARAGRLHRLHACGIAEAGALVEPGSVDFIITDPPYPRQYLPLYSDLSRFAALALKPGGSLLCLSGHIALPEVMARLGENLTYWWILSYGLPHGPFGRVWPRKVTAAWKPLLWYVKGQYAGHTVRDVVAPPPDAGDKEHHHWGQSLGGMRAIIEKFRLGAGHVVVCDPFCGGGSIGVAAVAAGCRFVGPDVDPDCIETTARRLAELDQPGATLERDPLRPRGPQA
jgi:site-specific DNA-methyltransferase (adenine-specific)